MQNKALFFGLTILLVSACPERHDDGQPNESDMTCDTDANCFNGFYCKNSICVADEPVDLGNGQDAGPNDTGNTGAVDAGPPDYPIETSDAFTVAINTPTSQSTAYTWEEIAFAGVVTVVTGTSADIDVTVTSSIDGELDSTFERDTGAVTATATLSEGNHTLQLRATRGDDAASTIVYITVCGYEMEENFDTEPDEAIWKRFDSAVYVEDGWIDMTNNQTSTWGKFFNVSQRVQPNNLDVQFKIYTGPLDAGADGFSMTIIDTPDVTSLEKILNCFTGLGNHLAPLRSTCELSVEELAPLQAFSIEFDTYANGFMCQASVNPY